MALKWEGFSGPPNPNLERQMYIVLKPTVAAGQRRNAGDIVELPAAEAANLLSLGRVEVAPEKPKAAPAKADRSVALKTSDAPAPKKRGRAKKNAD